MQKVALVIALKTTENSAKIVDCVWHDEQANVSNATELSKQGFRGFFLSEDAKQPNSNLGSSYKFFGEEGFPGFVSAQIADGNGVINVKAVLRVQDAFNDARGCIIFDPSTGEHATKISINGVDYDNNSTAFYFTIPKDTTEIEMLLLRWSAPYKNVKVTGFDTELDQIDVARRLVDLTYSQNTVPDSEVVSPEIVEQYLEASFYDTGRLFEVMYQMNQLTEGIKVTVFRQYENSATLLEVGTYLSEQWRFDADTHLVHLSCSDYTRDMESTEAASWPWSFRRLISGPQADLEALSVQMLLQQELSKMTGLVREDLLQIQMGEGQGLIFPASYKPEESVRKTIKDLCMTTVSSFFWDGKAFVLRRLY